MLSRRIRQANTLAMSQEGLSMHALRLIYSVVAQLSPDQEQFARVEIPLTEMQGILQVNQKNVYRDAKKAALELLNQTILLGDD
ncbi:MAG: replication initiation protein, partial [Trueperaceae bacterium]|nr:replication initiation protein [Trueperaceae bacterium]